MWALVPFIFIVFNAAFLRGGVLIAMTSLAMTLHMTSLAMTSLAMTPLAMISSMASLAMT